MSHHAIPGPSAGSSKRSLSLGHAFRRYFVTGLATLFPVVVTFWLLVKIFQIADGLLGRSLGIKIPGLGLVITLLVILTVGVFSVHLFGRVVFRTIEIWCSRLPLVKKIYPTVKQFAEFLFVEEGRQAGFQRVVLVEYPRARSYSIAFVTKEWQTMLLGVAQTWVTLLIPTPPSPFTGPIIFVPKEDIIPLALSVEEAFKLVLSGGVVAPSIQRSRANPINA